MLFVSLPLRERGLKFSTSWLKDWVLIVAPFTGAWIEILAWNMFERFGVVAPFTGAWIEILTVITHLLSTLRRSLYGSVD